MPVGPVSIMGILNVTPDSFSDGNAPGDPVARGRALWEAGADAIDVGGESTRPGAEPVPPEEEQRRVLPVIAALAAEGVRISIDTRNAATAAAALDRGAVMVNDVSGLTHDPAMAGLVAARACPAVLMHSRGTPRTMAALAAYDDVAAEVRAELLGRVGQAVAAGVRREAIILDPGFGFAKTPAQSTYLLRHLREIVALGFPVLAGVSRKSFIGRLGGGEPAAARDPGSLAAAVFALEQGAAWLRVHDVAGTIQGCRVWQALRQESVVEAAGCAI